jgi:hypothetical protein
MYCSIILCSYLVGKVVGRYGGKEYIAVDVRFADGRSRLFWPADLEELPAFDYHLDASDPDVVILRLKDGTFVAAFSAMGVTREGILEAAKEDYRERLRARAARRGHRIEGQQSDPSA